MRAVFLFRILTLGFVHLFISNEMCWTVSDLKMSLRGRHVYRNNVERQALATHVHKSRDAPTLKSSPNYVENLAHIFRFLVAYYVENIRSKFSGRKKFLM